MTNMDLQKNKQHMPSGDNWMYHGDQRKIVLWINIPTQFNNGLYLMWNINTLILNFFLFDAIIK